MKRAATIRDLDRSLAPARKGGRRIGFVPTMGALHQGHLALIAAAREQCDTVVVSIFVNPTQFDDKSDLDTYPRDLKRDEKTAAGAGVDVLFAPSVDEIYPESFNTSVNVEELTDLLCGAVRRGHFRGVTTIMAKLLNIVKPDVVYMGEKDYQQMVVVRQMAADLNMDVEIAGVPTVREPDGLAMSSRNALLSSAERAAATVLSRALLIAKDMVSEGCTDSRTLEERIRLMIAEEPLVRLEYLNIVDPERLRDVAEVRGEAVIAVAAHLGDTRLIDNVVVRAEGA